MANLEAQVPQGIEHVLDHALGVGGLFVGPHEQEIDVGEGCQRAASITAHRHQRQTLALGRIARPEHVDGGEIPKRGNHLVGDARYEPGCFDPTGPVLQPLLGDHPAPEQGRLEDFQRGLALGRLIALKLQCCGRELATQSHPVDNIFQAGGAKACDHDWTGI